MVLAKDEKTNIIDEFETHEGDTGSPEVQVAILSKRMEELSAHLKEHKKDIHSRRGLLGMVERRRKLLKYLESESSERYNQLIAKLGIRK